MSTTRMNLRRLRIGLVGGTAVVLATTFLAFEGAHLTIGAVNARGMPAVLYTLNAQQALVSANQAAAASFGNPKVVPLVGPGTEYQAQINLTSQSLEQIAAVNEAGASGSQAIESVDGQLATYTELIQQADAYYARGQDTIGAAEVWHAAQLLQAPGILHDFQTLQHAELAAVTTRGSSFWTGSQAVLLWVLPSTLLLASLVLAQFYLARRFRRRINWPLAAASLLLLAMAIGSVLLVRAEQRFAAAQRDLLQVVQERDAATRYTNNLGQFAVAALLPTNCRGAPGCGPTLTTFRAKLGSAPSSQAVHREPNAAAFYTTAAATAATADLAAAATSDGLPVTIPVVTVAVALLVLIGFQPRVNEYRYQP